MIDFSIPDDLQALRDRVLAFVKEKIVPYERDPRLTSHGPNDEMRQEMVELARAAGLLTPQAPKAFGGMELSHVEQAVVFEAAGWSTMGPVAMNCAAPDEANMLILSRVANAEQSEQFLRPVIEGHQRSVFAMTEPEGAGSDPSQLKTTARLDGDAFVIDGLKWLITGANGARTWIVMARLEPNDQFAEGPTLFLTEGDAPGIRIERVMNSMDRNFVQGHCVVRFEGLRVKRSGLLGEAGQAFRYAQLRLAPARLTHAMRWLGAAVRAQHIALHHANTRTAFGARIGEHQGVGFMLADNEIALDQCRLAIWRFMLADNEIALDQCRLAIWRACWLMDGGAKGRHESSMVKAFVSEELFKVLDRCVQVLGGIGITDETPVEMMFRDIRAFRLYDGPTEVHKFAIARKILRDAAA